MSGCYKGFWDGPFLVFLILILLILGSGFYYGYDA